MKHLLLEEVPEYFESIQKTSCRPVISQNDFVNIKHRSKHNDEQTTFIHI